MAHIERVNIGLMLIRSLHSDNINRFMLVFITRRRYIGPFYFLLSNSYAVARVHRINPIEEHYHIGAREPDADLKEARTREKVKNHCDETGYRGKILSIL